MTEPVRIEDHWLASSENDTIRFMPTPRIGDELNPRFIILHFTVGQSAEAAAAWLSRKGAGPSTHLVIGREGSIIQLAPLNRITFHCGPSQWGEQKGLDKCSIGIELDNAGPMTRKGDKWVFKFGSPFPDDEVFEAEHRHGGPYAAWHTYADAQIDALVHVLRAIVEAYEIEEILGHDDISPGRKWDPGPAFPMKDVKIRVFAKEVGNKEKTPEYKIPKWKYMDWSER